MPAISWHANDWHTLSFSARYCAYRCELETSIAAEDITCVGTAQREGIAAEVRGVSSAMHDSSSSTNWERGAEAVAFPGVNAPIPDGADPQAWAAQQTTNVRLMSLSVLCFPWRSQSHAR